VGLVDDRVFVPKLIHHKKYSKSRSVRTFLRIAKMCAGTTCGFNCTKFRGPCHV